MSNILEDSDTQLLLEYLDKIYAPSSDNEVIKEALEALKGIIETTEGSMHEDEASSEGDKSQARIMAMKQFMFTAKPDLLEHLLQFPGDTDVDVDEYTLTAKAEFLDELLKGYPILKGSVLPLIDQLLASLFREDLDDNPTLRAWALVARCPIVALLRPDPEAQDAHAAALKALSAKIKSFSYALVPELKASEMDETIRKAHEALIYGLLNLVSTPLEPDAVVPFIECGALDALLTIIARGPLSSKDSSITWNDSLDDACRALFLLVDNAKPEILAQVLVDRQVVGSILRHMAYICHHDNVVWAADIPRSLAVLAKSSDALLQQIVTEAQNMIDADPSELGSGVSVVLWKLLDCAADNDIEDLQKISKSKKYLPFFLRAIEPGASNNVLDAVGEALAARIDQPGRQLRKGISTPEQVEKITQLVEYACTQSAPDISPSMRVLRELILPSSDEDTGGWVDPQEELRRANKQFWATFAQTVKTRLDAASALAPEVTTPEPRDMVITEPSEVGLAHMKNVKFLVPLVEEQYTTMAILPYLAEYLQVLLLNPSPLSRRAGLELLTAMTKDSSLSKDFAFVPDLIEGYKLTVAYALSDPRKLIRAMALEWLNRLTGYRHPEAEDYSRYKPGVDFVLEVVTEDILAEMLKGTSDEVKVAAEMIQSMAGRSTGSEVANRLKKNKEIIEALWNAVFWDEDKAPPSQDQDISEDVFFYGNVEGSSASALSVLLDPLADLDSITEHIAPHITGLGDKDWFEFHGIVEKFPAIASLAILKPEIGVLSTLSKMTTQIEQLPFAMQLFRELSRGTMLAKVHIGQSDDVYAALVKVLQGEDESARSLVLLELDSMLSGSTVSNLKFMKEGGVKALLDIIASDTDTTDTRYALTILENFLENFPEGVQAAIDAGAIPILKSRYNPDDYFDRAGVALQKIESQKDAPLVDRIEFSAEAYAELGKKLPDPQVLERFIKNFESSMDERQLGIAGGLAPVLTKLLCSSPDPKPALKALKALLVIDGQGWQGFTVVQRTGEQCGLPEHLKPLTKSEDEGIRELSEAIMGTIVPRHEDTIEGSGGKGEGDDENDERGAENGEVDEA
ncbi:DNA mismatch repair protein MutS [Bartonella bacilliformis KC583] [Rhizoctonia solani]|uniref:DNA mismatch repair protein MutS [Bartonella bacilliformis KC583] n=1 Tax=Rhizoctonia solani TaxID=456999 RepID=A0A0K6GGL8_9AGAM|nr:DNA mismatch repair protein MutS [Bartonella bacilliformis KC583] [Rhizoctonia solani]